MNAQHRHVRTYPRCRHHRQPTTRLGWWWFDRHRGLVCRVCEPRRPSRPPSTLARR